MRTMMKITLPVAAGTRSIRDGSLPRLIQGTLDTLRPEAAYFYVDNGRRTSLLVFDLKDPTQIPSVCEPLFMGVDAEIQLIPVMNAQELQAGLGQMPSL
jgi:hypothetical protein